MNKPDPKSPEQQVQEFAMAVQMLGGIRQAARLLDCTERTVRDLTHGTRAIHRGWMEDMTRQLRDHASLCQHLARQLDPLFTANLTADQRAEKPDGRRLRSKAPRSRAEEEADQPLSDGLMARMADTWARSQEA